MDTAALGTSFQIFGEDFNVVIKPLKALTLDGRDSSTVICGRYRKWKTAEVLQVSLTRD
jgi:hypothetical protein